MFRAGQQRKKAILITKYFVIVKEEEFTAMINVSCEHNEHKTSFLFNTQFVGNHLIPTQFCFAKPLFKLF